MVATTALGAPFWRFWMAAAAANLADGVRAGAFPLVAVALGGTPVEIAAVYAAQQGAWFLFGLAAGGAADRHVPGRVVAAADAARVVVLAGLLALLLLGLATVPLLAGAAFVLGVAEVFRDTAAVSVVPRLVPGRRLERANARLVGAEVVGNEFAGPLLGAALVAVALALPVGVDAALLLVALVLVLTLAEARRPVPVADPGPGPGWTAGFRELRAHRDLLAVTGCGAVVAFADAAWWSVLVLVSAELLGLPPAGFGALLAAGAVGGLLGALGAERVAHRLGPARSLPVAAVLTGLPAAGIAVSGSAVAVGVLLAVSSAGFALWNVVAVSLRQRRVPAAVLGRVSAVHRLALAGGGTAGALTGGALAAAGGPAVPLLAAALLSVAAALGLALVLHGPAGTESGGP